jgi:hypothetical protein
LREDSFVNVTPSLWVSIAAVCISLVSACISLFSLGWNIYRDVILKPRLKVDLCFADAIPHRTGNGTMALMTKREIKTQSTVIMLEAVNHGPGSIQCNSVGGIAGRFGKKSRTFISPDANHYLADQLPKTLAPGDTIKVVFPIRSDGFLGQDVKRIGFKDSYDRMHWAPRSSVKAVVRTFRNHFNL